MMSSNLEVGLFQMRAEKRYKQYNSQELLLRCDQFLLFFIQSTRPVAYEVVASIFQLPKV